MEKNTRELAETPIKSLLWKYFLPAFIGVVVNSLYNIVDRIFIGQGVGAIALSALSVVFPIMILIAAFGILVGMGAGAKISLDLGKKKLEEAKHTLGNAITLMTIISLIVTIIGLFTVDFALELFGAAEETILYAQSYLRIILVGSVFQVLGFGLNNIIRSEGNAKVAMYSIVLSAVVNIILDYLFIYQLHWGVKGAAWATVISQIVLTIWVLVHFKSERALVSFENKYLKLDSAIVKATMALGLAPFAMQLGSSMVQSVLNRQLIHYGGDIAVGALGIIYSVIILVFMSMFAINMAAQPIIGYNYGAKQFRRVKEAWFLSIFSATVIATVSWIIIMLFPEPIIRIFNTDNNEILNVGVRGIRIFSCMLPVIGFQVVSGSYFQSIGKAKTSMFLSLLRQLIFLIPLLLIIPRFHGLDGVWACSPVSDFASAIVVLVFSVREVKILNKAIEEQENSATKEMDIE